MPFKANQDCRHHIPRQRYQMTNWQAYDTALRHVVRDVNNLGNVLWALGDLARASSTSVRSQSSAAAYLRDTRPFARCRTISPHLDRIDRSLARERPRGQDNMSGNTFNNTGDFRSAAVFQGSTINNAGQIAGTIASADAASRDELQALLKQLGDALRPVPPEKVEAAEATASTAEDLVKEAAKDKPNKSRLRSLGEGPPRSSTLSGVRHRRTPRRKPRPSRLHPVSGRIGGRSKA